MYTMRQFSQYYTAICANFLSIGYGNILGWSSPIVPVLQSDQSPLDIGKLTNEHISWLTSVIGFGSILGCVIVAFVADRFGRKIAIFATALPMILNWILLIFASSYVELIIARFVGGMAGGGAFLVIPLYVTEIAEDNIRGTLGSLVQIGTNFGLIMGFALGGYLDYYLILYLFLILPVLLICGFIFIPETPAYLFSKNKIIEGEKSLKFFRGYKNNSTEFSSTFVMELQHLKNKAEKNHTTTKFSTEDFTKKSAVHAILLGICLFTMMQANGGYMILTYIVIIFGEAGTSISPNLASIIVAVVNLIGTYVATVLVDRIGRRPLMIWSCVTSTICLIITGIYFYLKFLRFDIDNYSWIPIVSLAAFFFNSAWGVMALPFIIASEMLPIKIRGAISMFFRLLLSIFGFLFLKYFYSLQYAIELHGCMVFFAINCSVMAVIVYFWLPETKGKSIDEIVAGLEGKKK